MNIIEVSKQNQIVLDLYSKLIDDRIIFINQPITMGLATEIQSCLLYLKSKSSDPIDIYINSPGGSVYAGLAIYDTIKHLQKQGVVINTYATGLVASMAAILLISGNTRFSLPNSTIMFHQISSFTEGKLEDMKVDLKETERLQNVLNEIITKEVSKEILNYCKYTDFYLDSQKAIEFSVIHKIL